jgi:putative transposase
MRLKHYDDDGRARFITFCTHKKLKQLTNNCSRYKLLETIDEARKQYFFKLVGYVIMPEHVHLVIIPEAGTPIGAMIGEIKRVSAKLILPAISEPSLLKRLTIERNGRIRRVLWQRRCYDHNCRSSGSMWEKVNYCHYNPVKRGLVLKPEQWRWSSYRWYAGLEYGGIEMDTAAD